MLHDRKFVARDTDLMRHPMTLRTLGVSLRRREYRVIVGQWAVAEVDSIRVELDFAVERNEVTAEWLPMENLEGPLNAPQFSLRRGGILMRPFTRKGLFLLLIHSRPVSSLPLSSVDHADFRIWTRRAFFPSKTDIPTVLGIEKLSLFFQNERIE